MNMTLQSPKLKKCCNVKDLEILSKLNQNRQNNQRRYDPQVNGFCTEIVCPNSRNLFEVPSQFARCIRLYGHIFLQIPLPFFSVPLHWFDYT